MKGSIVAAVEGDADARDRDDSNRASWYSELACQFRGTRPVRSELTWMIVGLDLECSRETVSQPWEQFYAGRMVQHLACTVQH